MSPYLNRINFREKIFKIDFQFSRELIYAKKPISSILRELILGNFTGKIKKGVYKANPRHYFCDLKMSVYTGNKFCKLTFLVIFAKSNETRKN